MNTFSKSAALESLATSTKSEVQTSDNGVIYFKEYDSQLAIPEVAGTRIVKCLYKTDTKTGKKGGTNSYIRVPSEHINEETIAERIDELAPFLVSYLQSKEDEIIKAAHKAGIQNLYIPSLSLDSVIEYLEENETSGRLNKEIIEAWFDSSVEPNLAELFAAKLGITVESSEVELAKLQTVLNAYKAKFASLASPKVSLKPEDCEALISVIEKTEANSSILGKRFIKKLEVMKTKVEDTLLSL